MNKQRMRRMNYNDKTYDNAVIQYEKLVFQLMLTPEEWEKWNNREYFIKHPNEFKKCRICGQIKHISCFYKHPMKKQGVFDECKECLRRKASDRRRKVSEPDYPGEE